MTSEITEDEKILTYSSNSDKEGNPIFIITTINEIFNLKQLQKRIEERLDYFHKVAKVDSRVTCNAIIIHILQQILKGFKCS